MKFSVFLFCFLFFTWTLLSQENHQHESQKPAQPEAKLEKQESQCKQECEKDVHSLKNQFEKFREDLENSKKDQDVIHQQHKFMDEAIKKMENLIQQYESTIKIQSQKLEDTANTLQQLKEDTTKQINKVDEKYASLKKEIKNSNDLPKQISSVENKCNTRLTDLKNQTDTLQKKIDQMEASNFMNVASQTFSNLLETALISFEVMVNYVSSMDWSWIQDRVVWKLFYEYCMESFENSKRYIQVQLIPAFKTQAIHQYTHFKQLFENLCDELHHHQLFRLALERCRPYLNMANIPQMYHRYMLDGAVVVGIVIALLITYGVFLLICGLLCPVIPKNPPNETNTEKTNTEKKTSKKKGNKHNDDNERN